MPASPFFQIRPLLRPLPGLVLLAPVLLVAACGDLLGTDKERGPFTLAGLSFPDGAVGAPVLGPFTLFFSRSLDGSTVAQGVSFRAHGRPLNFYFELGGNSLRIIPTDPLDFGTLHEVVVTPSLLSLDGEAMGGSARVTFTTEGLPLPSPSADSLLHHIEALAHDSMEGRGSGSDHELRAAHYLQERFQSYGLVAPPQGMIQPFEATSRRGDTLLASRNVLALLPGSGILAGEWVVVGAHYDHIGYRDLADGSQGPNNGADDNASGTAMVLELARAFQGWVGEGGDVGRHRRSVVFAAWGAEEEGLLGSCHYVGEAPAVPLSNTRALLNFDMVGRLRAEGLVVSGAETSGSWPPAVHNANAAGVTVTHPTASGASGTDHACFWQAAIPWLGFYTRTHSEYHTPADDVELINVPGMVDIGELALRVLTRATAMPQAPAFQGPIPDLQGGE